MSKRAVAGALLVLLVAVGIVLYKLTRPRASEPGSEEATSVNPPSGQSAAGATPPQSAGNDAGLGSGPSSRSPEQQALEAYKQWARYPPLSRPAAEQADQWVPHPFVSTVLPLDPDRPNKARLRKSQDRLFILPGEGAVATVEGLAPSAAGPLVVEKAELARFEGSPQALSAPIANVQFRDDGVPPDAVSNDGILSAAVIPPFKGQTGIAGDLRLSVTVRLNGDHGETSFSFVGTGEPPGRFSGTARDALEDGSLALYVGVELRQPGRYLVVGRLYDAAGRPVALLHYNDIVDTSLREVRLLAFGKLLRDSGGSSPFVLRDVQGQRMTEGGPTDRQLLAMWPGPYKTAAYRNDAFSDLEWDSPSKRRRLVALEQVANGHP